MNMNDINKVKNCMDSDIVKRIIDLKKYKHKFIFLIFLI
jgi:hypothetical protein